MVSWDTSFSVLKEFGTSAAQVKDRIFGKIAWLDMKQTFFLKFQIRDVIGFLGLTDFQGIEKFAHISLSAAKNQM